MDRQKFIKHKMLDYDIRVLDLIEKTGFAKTTINRLVNTCDFENLKLITVMIFFNNLFFLCEGDSDILDFYSSFLDINNV